MTHYFYAVEYKTSEAYFNDKVNIYFATEKSIHDIVKEDLQNFFDDNIKVFAHTVRHATRDEIITYIEEEAEKEDLIILIEQALNL